MAASQAIFGQERRRGRPSVIRAAAIEHNIRRAALDIFVAAGFEAASMDAIAAAAQVSKGTLYARYQSKEALFRSVLEHELEQLSDRAGAQDHLLPGALEERLRQHVRTMVRVMHWPEFERIERLVASASLALPDLHQLWHEITIRRYLEFLAGDMATVAQLPPDSAFGWDHLANIFLHTIAGWFRTESTIRTVGEDEVLRYSDAVIGAISVAVRQTSNSPSFAEKASSQDKD